MHNVKRKFIPYTHFPLWNVRRENNVKWKISCGKNDFSLTALVNMWMAKWDNFLTKASHPMIWLVVSFATNFEWRQWYTKQFSVLLWALESFYLLTPHNMAFIFCFAAWISYFMFSRTTQWNKKRKVYLSHECLCMVYSHRTNYYRLKIASFLLSQKGHFTFLWEGFEIFFVVFRCKTCTNLNLFCG